MPPKFRLVVDALNANDIEEIYELLRIDLDPENVELDDNGLVYCYANTPHAVKRVRQDIKASLGRYNVLGEVTTPICVERWNAQQRSCVGAIRATPALVWRRELAFGGPARTFAGSSQWSPRGFSIGPKSGRSCLGAAGRSSRNAEGISMSRRLTNGTRVNLLPNSVRSP